MLNCVASIFFIALMCVLVFLLQLVPDMTQIQSLVTCVVLQFQPHVSIFAFSLLEIK